MSPGPAVALPELLERVGDVGQIASVTPVTFSEGATAGVRALDVRTIEGLHATVLLDRGMDLGSAWYGGTPLAWMSPGGPVHPAIARSGDRLSSFPGGLMVTAGTQNVGDACEVDGIRHALHGELSTIPARDVRWEIAAGPSPAVIVEGTVREVAVLGVDVELRRRLRFEIGRPQITVEDAVRNRGDRPAKLMLLYHINVGWPIVDEASELFGWPDEVLPRAGDQAAAAALGENARFAAPRSGWPSQVFEHRGEIEPPQRILGIVNPQYEPTAGIALAVTYRPDELPRLWRWRMFGKGTYLTAIEPANCSLSGRAAAIRDQENLATLAPGDERAFTITFAVHTGRKAREMAGQD